jgi:hypothetical protein
MRGTCGARLPKTVSQGVRKRSPSNESASLYSSPGSRPTGCGSGTATCVSPGCASGREQRLSGGASAGGDRCVRAQTTPSAVRCRRAVLVCPNFGQCLPSRSCHCVRDCARRAAASGAAARAQHGRTRDSSAKRAAAAAVDALRGTAPSAPSAQSRRRGTPRRRTAAGCTRRTQPAQATQHACCGVRAPGRACAPAAALCASAAAREFVASTRRVEPGLAACAQEERRRAAQFW